MFRVKLGNFVFGKRPTSRGGEVEGVKFPRDEVPVAQMDHPPSRLVALDGMLDFHDAREARQEVAGGKGQVGQLPLERWVVPLGCSMRVVLLFSNEPLKFGELLNRC